MCVCRLDEVFEFNRCDSTNRYFYVLVSLVVRWPKYASTVSAYYDGEMITGEFHFMFGNLVWKWR